MTKAQAEVIEEAVRESNKNTKVLQIENHYPIGNRYHHFHQGKVVDYLHRDHPRFTTLSLQWSHKGEWCGLPKDPNAKIGPEEDVHNYLDARLEPYIHRCP